MIKGDQEITKVVCPYCNYSMPLITNHKTNISHLILRCKGRNCKKDFEVKVVNGVQHF